MSRSIFIVNNAGLFFIYDQIRRGHIWSKNLIINLTPFWLDNIDQNHADHLWGQSIRSFPITLQKILLRELSSPIDDSKPLTWGQVQSLRQIVIEKLRQFPNILILQGVPSFHLEGNETQLKIQQSTLTITPADQLFAWWKIPNKHFLERESPYMATLYQVPIREVPRKICLFSDSSLKTVSLVTTDFPERDVTLISNKSNLNSTLQIGNRTISVLNPRRDEINSVNSTHLQYFLNSVESSCVYYNANGFKHFTLPELKTFQFAWDPSRVKCNWVAPKVEGEGTLIHSWHLLHHLAEQPLPEIRLLSQRFCSEFFFPLLLERAKDAGLTLSTNFFNALAHEIKESNHPLSETELLLLYARIYRSTEQVNTQQLIQFMFMLGEKKLQLQKMDNLDCYAAPTQSSILTAPESACPEQIVDDFLGQERIQSYQTPNNTIVLYTGGFNQQLAMNWAKINGKMTIEMTQGGEMLSSSSALNACSSSQQHRVWNYPSQAFALAASGTVNIIALCTNPPKATSNLFNSELPIIIFQPSVNDAVLLCRSVCLTAFSTSQDNHHFILNTLSIMVTDLCLGVMQNIIHRIVNVFHAPQLLTPILFSYCWLLMGSDFPSVIIALMVALAGQSFGFSQNSIMAMSLAAHHLNSELSNSTDSIEETSLRFFLRAASSTLGFWSYNKVVADLERSVQNSNSPISFR